MKSKYFLHRQNEPMRPDTVVYRVWVGQSEREQKKLADLKSWAGQVGATIRPWSEDIDYYLLLESERVFPAHGLLNFGFPSASISVQEAVKHAEVNDWDIFESNLSTPKSYFYMQTSLRSAHVDAAKGRIENRSVLPEPRKNLSQNQGAKPFIIRFI